MATTTVRPGQAQLEKLVEREQKIRELAYQKWEDAGSPQGNDGTQFWLEAEAELNEKKNQL